MEKLRKFVVRQSKTHSQPAVAVAHSKSDPNDWINESPMEHELPPSIFYHDESFPPSPMGSPSLTHEPQSMQEIVDQVEEDYFSMTFDSGLYEIENQAGSTCRAVPEMKSRLLRLGKLNKTVGRYVSKLVLEKHPLYDAELKGVLSLQTDNKETLVLCQQLRRSLKQSANVLVLRRLTVLRNFRRLVRMQTTLRVLQQVRTLQNSVHQLDALIGRGNFHAAIELHRESLVTLEQYRPYRCIEPIRVKLKAFGLRIDDLLDAELHRSCEHFSNAAYTTVQQAFELLGSTQTTFAQLQVHYIAAIQRRSATLLQSRATNSTEGDDSSTTQTSPKNYADLCQTLKVTDLPECLSAVCQTLWLVMLCYHRTVFWHQQRARGVSCDQLQVEPKLQSDNDSYVFAKAKSKRPGNVNNSVNPADSTGATNPIVINSNGPVQLIRQWHDYVAAKLHESRLRIWAEITSRIEPVLKAMGQSATEMTFDQISSVLRTMDHFVKIGQEFCGSLSPELLEVVRTSIHAFFKSFHRKHMERLRMFLENETWELCPVKSTFTVFELQEFRVLAELFQGDVKTGSLTTFNRGNQESGATETRFFEQPYCTNQFPLCATTSANNSPRKSIQQSDPPSQDSVQHGSNYRSTSCGTISGRVVGRLLSNTTLEVLRLIGRYMQMMHFLQPIAAEVMHCICQVFDYYLYSLLDTPAELPDRLRSTLKRITERLVLADNAVQSANLAKGDRFPLPAHEPLHVLHGISHWRETMSSTKGADQSDAALCVAYLQAHLVGVESVVCLAEILESVLLPHLSSCLPERKRGLTSVFREQSLLIARLLREPCASQVVPQIVQLLLPNRIRAYSHVRVYLILCGTLHLDSQTPFHSSETKVNLLYPPHPSISLTSTASSDTNTPQTTTTGTFAASFSRLWPIGSSSATTTHPSDSAVTPSSGSISPQSALDAQLIQPDSNCLTPWIVTGQSWTGRDVATHPSDYVRQLHTTVLTPFATLVQQTLQRLGLGEPPIRSVLWAGLLAWIGRMLLNAFGQIHACSDEARGQMLLDVQSIAAQAERESKSSFPKLDHVIEYIQAFYIPIHDWEHWLTQNGSKYTRAQLTGLAHCLARGDRRQRQRLLNTLNQIYTATTTISPQASLSNQSSNLIATVLPLVGNTNPPASNNNSSNLTMTAQSG